MIQKCLTHNIHKTTVGCEIDTVSDNINLYTNLVKLELVVSIKIV